MLRTWTGDDRLTPELIATWKRPEQLGAAARRAAGGGPGRADGLEPADLDERPDRDGRPGRRLGRPRRHDAGDGLMGFLDGQVAIVTGAAQGLGAAYADGPGRGRRQVVAVDEQTWAPSRSVGALGRGRREPGSTTCAGWSTSPQSEHGGVDILVNNAARWQQTPDRQPAPAGARRLPAADGRQHPRGLPDGPRRRCPR